MFSLKTYADSLNFTRNKTFLTVASVSMACLMLTGAMSHTARKNVNVTVIDDFSGVDMVENVETREESVGGLLAAMNIAVEESDTISMNEEDALRDGDSVVIKRGRKITLEVDGEVKNMIATDKRVGEVIDAEGIKLYANDIVTPAVDTVVKEGDAIKIVRVTYKDYEKHTAKIPYQVTTIYDDTMDKGTSYVKQEGTDGVKELSYATTYHDGEVVSRGVVAEHVVTPAVDKVIVVGSKVNYHKGFAYSRKLTVEATAYEPFNCGGDGRGITASGIRAQFGVVAVDPKVIPLGTKLYIESPDDGASWVYGYCIAADTGGAIKKNRIDLCYNTMSECIQFGRKKANVYILE